MQRRLLYSAVLFITCSLMTSCLGVLTLPKGEKLYRGAKVKVKYEKGVPKSSALEQDLQAAIQLPKPNPSFLGFRPRITINNLTKKGTYLNRKWGVEPVLFSQQRTKQTLDLLENRAFNNGYFEAKVDYKIKKRPFRKRKVKYIVRLKESPMRIESLRFPDKDTPLTQLFLAEKNKSRLQPNQPYSLAALRAERERLAEIAKDKGYYFFDADYLFFTADTSGRNGLLSLVMDIKPKTPEKALKKYTLGAVNIKMAQSVNWEVSDTTATIQNPELQCARLFQELPLLDTALLWRALDFKCGQLLTPRSLQNTYIRLSHLGVFRFIDLHPEPSPVADSIMIADITLLPYKRYKTDANISGILTPNFQRGFQASTSLLRRNNALKANALQITGSGGFYDIQESLAFQNQDLSYQEWEIRGDYGLPRFGGIFKNQKSKKGGFLKHQLSASYEGKGYDFAATDEFEAYGIRQHKIEGSWNLNWQNSQKPTRSQGLQPFQLAVQWTRFRPTELNRSINEILREDPDNDLLAFAPQLSFEPEYRFNYDNRPENRLHLSTFSQSIIRFSSTGFLLPPATLNKINQRYRFRLFLEEDLRFFQKPDSRQVVVSRVHLRLGIPINATQTAVFNPQDLYSAGGASSIRAFPLRGLGPGTLPPGTSGGAQLGVSGQLGNLHIETNFEHRFTLSKKWETALFLDAGNVWLTHPAPADIGGKFEFKDFYKEIALGTGLGLRYKFEFLTIRLDWGIRLRTPYLEEGERWVAIRPQQGNWWANQTALNFAFGYPF